MNHTPVNFDSMDEVLLTPENFKTSKPEDKFSLHSLLSQPTTYANNIPPHAATQLPSELPNGGHPPGSVPVNLLDLLQKKDSTVPLPILSNGSTLTSSIPIPTLPTPTTSEISPRSSPSKNSNSSTSPERWAGAAYMNSPDPRTLPIPAFVGSTDDSPTIRHHNRSHSLPRISFSNAEMISSNLSPVKPSRSSHHISNETYNAHTAPSSQPSTPMGKRAPRKKERHPSPPQVTSSSRSNPNSISPSKKDSKQQQFILEARKRKQNQPQSQGHVSTPALSYDTVRIASRPTPTVEPQTVAPPKQDYDNMSNHLKMMLNICNA